MTVLYIVGFPSLYGGAGAELYHQVRVWETLGVTLHFIPTQKNVRKAALYGEMTERGHMIHDAYDWSVIPEGAPVISFCNEDFLAALPEIRRRTRRTVFVNCMTWLFGKEKEAMSRGDIALFLYQNDKVWQNVMPRLRALNGDPSVRFMTFRPYFDSAAFPYVAGKPPDWVETFHDQKALSQQEFYRRCHIVLQPTDTTENWPRVGFEAMASGSVLIVDKRGGWEQMIEHGRTGWLCESPGDFIAYASKMAWEPHYREDMAAAARERGLELGGLGASLESWRQVFDVIEEL
ncbi:MAG: glycosyltransferase [Akkermansia sp.]|uniref:glycosyltransferase n=2 Tax=Akkermansia sp. TaxID=1872421 RepID=UPI002E77E0FD|nr:glycosyltransferase [Akkermansia sp.]MEE0764665.1 glycosyltransferase [Akkermansia sp.]